MSRAGSVAYGAAVIALMLLAGQDMSNSALFLYDYLTPSMLGLAVAGCAIATFGPLTLSICIWRLVKRIRARWIPHLLFIPCAVALLWGGGTLLYFASGWPIDSMAVDLFMMLAVMLLCLTVLVHAASLVVELVGMFRRRAGLR